jgi:hypothetical protein
MCNLTMTYDKINLSYDAGLSNSFTATPNMNKLINQKVV